MKKLLTGTFIIVAVANGFTATYDYKIRYNNFSVGNINENAYFNNEMEQALIDYKGLDESVYTHTHSVEIIDPADSFTMKISSIILYQNIITSQSFFNYENHTDVEQLVVLPEIILKNTNEIALTKKPMDSSQDISKSVYTSFGSFSASIPIFRNLNQKLYVEKNQKIDSQTFLVPPHKKVQFNLIHNLTVSRNIYHFLVPIDGNKWCKKDISVLGSTYQISPAELYSKVKNDKNKLNNYFGLAEFYEYKSFLQSENLEHDFWAASEIKSIEKSETWDTNYSISNL